MRKLLLAILLLSSASFVAYFSIVKFKSVTVGRDEQNVLGKSPDLRESKFVDLELGEKEYRLFWEGPFEGDAISLIFNKNTLTATEAYQKYNCGLLTNAGFYDLDRSAIGLFISEHKEYSPFQKNKLFNAIFSINDFGTARISGEVPKDRLKIALQAGPMLIENSFEQDLKLNSDKHARRSILAVDGNNEVYYLIVYDRESKFEGPLLATLPEILKLFELKTDIKIADAINLDGGTASAFITEDLSFTELSPVGSFFCIDLK